MNPTTNVTKDRTSLLISRSYSNNDRLICTTSSSKPIRSPNHWRTDFVFVGVVLCVASLMCCAVSTVVRGQQQQSFNPMPHSIGPTVSPLASRSQFTFPPVSLVTEVITPRSSTASTSTVASQNRLSIGPTNGQQGPTFTMANGQQTLPSTTSTPSVQFSLSMPTVTSNTGSNDSSSVTLLSSIPNYTLPPTPAALVTPQTIVTTPATAIPFISTSVTNQMPSSPVVLTTIVNVSNSPTTASTAATAAPIISTVSVTPSTAPATQTLSTIQLLQAQAIGSNPNPNSNPPATTTNTGSSIQHSSISTTPLPALPHYSPFMTVPNTHSNLASPRLLIDSSTNANKTGQTIKLGNSTYRLLTPNRSVLMFNNSSCSSDRDCNNGICHRATGSNRTQCFCHPGYTGLRCQIDVDECAQHPCLNGATCLDREAMFECVCATGYTGPTCESEIDYCIRNPCLNNASCIGHTGGFDCKCPTGFEGRLCEKNVDDCKNNPCLNNGTCSDLVGGYRCDCRGTGFEGEHCENNINDCSPSLCKIGTRECIDLVNDYKCVCYEGFTGTNCEIDVHECEPNPCLNDGICHEKSLQLSPTAASLTLGSYYASDLGANGLGGTNTTLISQYAGYTCECKEEYYGERCEERKKCYTKPIEELCQHSNAQCVNAGTSYECLVNASFDGTGNNYAEYAVRSPDSFKLQQISIKFKSVFGGVLLSFRTATSHSVSSSPLSSLSLGGGRTTHGIINSNNIVELQLNSSGIYFNGTAIDIKPASSIQDLLDGHEREFRVELPPTEIKEIMLARPVPQSSSQQQSVSLQPSFKGCIMQVRLNDRLLPFIQMPDYGANDSTQIFDLKESRLELDRCRTCFDGDCHNNGRCDDNFDGFQCECPSTFIGARCELDNDECTSGSNPCRNGHCKNLHGGFECICNPGYGGEKCTEITDTCLAKKPCQNGGICKTISGQAFICECLSSHFGRKCEKPRTCINECRAQHSHCVNNSTCACLPGPKAERTMCQFIASCEHMSNLCQNGGTCVNKDGGGYVCLCPDLYQGLVCELHVAPSQPDLILLLAIATACLLIVIFVTVSTMVIRGVRRARATRGIYSPSRQEMFGNSASDILKPPPCERLI